MSEKTRVKYDHIREQISKMHKIVSDMLQVAHNMEYRSSGLSHDMKLVSSGLRFVCVSMSMYVCMFVGSY